MNRSVNIKAEEPSGGIASSSKITQDRFFF
jgi:hypothetical protein